MMPDAKGCFTVRQRRPGGKAIGSGKAGGGGTAGGGGKAGGSWGGGGVVCGGGAWCCGSGDSDELAGAAGADQGGGAAAAAAARLSALAAGKRPGLRGPGLQHGKPQLIRHALRRRASPHGTRASSSRAVRNAWLGLGWG